MLCHFLSIAQNVEPTMFFLPPDHSSDPMRRRRPEAIRRGHAQNAKRPPSLSGGGPLRAQFEL